MMAEQDTARLVLSETISEDVQQCTDGGELLRSVHICDHVILSYVCATLSYPHIHISKKNLSLFTLTSDEFMQEREAKRIIEHRRKLGANISISNDNFPSFSIRQNALYSLILSLYLNQPTNQQYCSLAYIQFPYPIHIALMHTAPVYIALIHIALLAHIHVHAARIHTDIVTFKVCQSPLQNIARNLWTLPAKTYDEWKLLSAEIWQEKSLNEGNNAIIDGGTLMRNGIEFPYAGGIGTSPKGLLYNRSRFSAEQKRQIEHLKQKLCYNGVTREELKGLDIPELEAKLKAVLEAKQVTCSSISVYPVNILARSELVRILRHSRKRSIKKSWKRSR